MSPEWNKPCFMVREEKRQRPRGNWSDYTAFWMGNNLHVCLSLCSQKRLVRNGIQQWLFTTGMLRFLSKGIQNWWKKERWEEGQRRKKLCLSVSHYFTVNRDIQPLNQALILARFLDLSFSRVALSLNPSIHSEHPSDQARLYRWRDLKEE